MTIAKKDDLVKISTDKSQVQRIVNKTVEGDAVIFIGKSKIKSREQWVMLFPRNLVMFLNQFHKKLSLHDIRVLFCVMDKMAYGNAINIKQTAIAKEINSHQANVSKSWATLKESGIFLADEFGSEFLNYDLILKGGGKVATETYLDNSTKSHEKMRSLNIHTNQPFPVPKKLKIKDALPVEPTYEEQEAAYNACKSFEVQESLNDYFKQIVKPKQTYGSLETNS